MKGITYITGTVLFIIYSLILEAQPQNALDFDGVEDYARAPYTPSLNLSQDFTISAWLYPTALTMQYCSFVNRGDLSNPNYQFWLGFNYNHLYFDFKVSYVYYDLTTTSSFPANVWMHVTLVYNQAQKRATFYVNGIFLDSKVFPVDILDDSGAGMRIGGDQQYTNQYFKGKIDEMRIWNIALTEQQIRDNMYGELPNPADDPNLKAYYQFNQTSGLTLPDLSSYGNNAVLNPSANPPLWVTSTAPIPYYTVDNGSWNNNANWAVGQNAPVNDWARVSINNDISIASDEVAKDLTINSSGAITIDPLYSLSVTGSLINSGLLMILSDNSGTGSLIENNGVNATMQRYYLGGEWHLISSPVSNAVSGMFSGLYLQYHNEITNAYNDITPLDIPLNPMQGYAIWNNSTATAEFSGPLNTGLIGSANNLSRSGAGTNKGWNLVGNPYCSSIDWDASAGWTKSNINNAIYVHVNASTWATYIAGVGLNGGTQYIAPGQGFFVSVSNAGSPYPNFGTLEMDNSVRAHNNTSFFKDEVTNLARIQISGNGYHDETVVRFTDEATAAFDGDFDAYKLFGNTDEAAQIYSIAGQPLAINSLPQTDAIPLGVRTGTNGVYTIEATEINDLEIVTLEDTETGIFSDLLSNKYTFNLMAGESTQRFILHFSPVAVEEVSTITSGIYALNGQVYINYSGTSKGQAFIYNISGQLVNSSNLIMGMNQIPVHQTGNFIVKVISDKGVYSQKVFIQ